MKIPQYINRVRKSTAFLPGVSPRSGSFLVASVLLFLQLLFIRPYFLVNDDISKILLAKGMGANGVPTEFFGYSNVLLGFLFKQWFAWFPAHPWYGWFLCAVQFLSLWVLLWMLLRRPVRGFHTVLFIISCVSLNFVFFSFLQFTMTAALAAQVGILVFCFYPETQRDYPRDGLLGMAAFLLLLSALLRLDSFLLMLLVSLPLFIYKTRDKDFRGFWRRHQKLFYSLTLFILCSALFHSAWFQRSPEWREYGKFDKERLELQDYRIVDYSPETKPFFDSVGWSENDLWCFKNWFYMDPEKFSVEKIRGLKIHFPRVGAGEKTASHRSILELAGSFWDQRFLLFFLAFAFFCRRKFLPVLSAQFLWIAAFFFFLVYFMRAPDRVTLPCLLYLVNLGLLFSEPNPFGAGKARWIRWAPAVILLVFFVSSLPGLRNTYLQNLQRRQIEDRAGIFLRQLNPSKDQLYVMWGFRLEDFNAFDDFERFRPLNMFLTAFFQRSPPATRALRAFGAENLPLGLVDNPKVFLICFGAEGVHLVQYLRENYHKEIRASLAYGCDYFKVYSIHTFKTP